MWASTSIIAAEQYPPRPTDRRQSVTVSVSFILIAARNEADRLGATLAALADAFPGSPVWVADDGSRDRTSAVARAAGATALRSERALGKGAAATLTARAALAELRPPPDGVVVLCDADLGASAGRLAGLLDPLRRGEAELTVADFARRQGGGLGVAVGFARRAIRRRCDLLLRAPISGQRALRVRTLEDVLPFASGFGMELGMTIDAARRGHRVHEVTLDLEHRATGRTLAGFAHRARQLLDLARADLRRRHP
jgi:glycosyltransferase involved in cell wall biosynthesis